jgi:lysophospholipase L1-like esterase
VKPRPFTRYVALGDSFTEGLNDPEPNLPNAYVGWADRLAAHLARSASRDNRAFGYANLAVRGRLLDDIAGQQVDDALALEPDLVSIVGGGNDILRPKADIDALAARLEHAVARLRAGGADVLLATPVDPRNAPLMKATRGRAAIFTAHIWSIARRHDAYVVDQWGMAALLDWRMWAPDRIHLTTDGHARVAQAALVSLGLAPDDFAWDDPLAPLPPVPRIRQLRDDARWVRDDVYPWATRRLRGQSSGATRVAKRPELAPVE